MPSSASISWIWAVAEVQEAIADYNNPEKRNIRSLVDLQKRIKEITGCSVDLSTVHRHARGRPHKSRVSVPHLPENLVQPVSERNSYDRLGVVTERSKALGDGMTGSARHVTGNDMGRFHRPLREASKANDTERFCRPLRETSTIFYGSTKDAGQSFHMGQVDAHPHPDAHDHRLGAARPVAQATTKMIEMVKNCQGKPQTVEPQIALRAAAEDLQKATTHAASDQIEKRAIQRLENATRATAANATQTIAAAYATQTIAAANAVESTSTSRVHQEELLIVCTETGEYVPRLISSIKQSQATTSVTCGTVRRDNGRNVMILV